MRTEASASGQRRWSRDLSIGRRSAGRRGRHRRWRGTNCRRQQARLRHSGSHLDEDDAGLGADPTGANEAVVRGQLPRVGAHGAAARSRLVVVAAAACRLRAGDQRERSGGLQRQGAGDQHTQAAAMGDPDHRANHPSSAVPLPVNLLNAGVHGRAGTRSLRTPPATRTGCRDREEPCRRMRGCRARARWGPGPGRSARSRGPRWRRGTTA
jgi:hypothetical protein